MRPIQSQKQPSFSLWAKKIHVSRKITLSLLCSWKSTSSFSPTRLKFASNIFCFVTKFSTLVTKVWLPSLLIFDKIDETFLLIHVTCSVLGNGKWHSIQMSFLKALKRLILYPWCFLTWRQLCLYIGLSVFRKWNVGEGDEMLKPEMRYVC